MVMKKQIDFLLRKKEKKTEQNWFHETLPEIWIFWTLHWFSEIVEKIKSTVYRRKKKIWLQNKKTETKAKVDKFLQYGCITKEERRIMLSKLIQLQVEKQRFSILSSQKLVFLHHVSK